MKKRVNNEQCKHFMKLLPTFDGRNGQLIRRFANPRVVKDVYHSQQTCCHRCSCCRRHCHCCHHVFSCISLKFQAAGSGIDPTNTISRISPTYQKIIFQRVLFRKLRLEEDVPLEMVPFQVTFVHFFGVVIISSENSIR